MPALTIGPAVATPHVGSWLGVWAGWAGWLVLGRAGWLLGLGLGLGCDFAAMSVGFKALGKD